MGELPAAELVMPDEIAAEHRARAHAGFEHARSMGVQPTLVAVMASDNESAKVSLHLRRPLVAPLLVSQR